MSDPAVLQASNPPAGLQHLNQTTEQPCVLPNPRGFRGGQNRLAPQCKLPALGSMRSWGLTGTANSRGTAWVSSLSQRKTEEVKKEKEKETKAKWERKWNKGKRVREKEEKDDVRKKEKIWVCMSVPLGQTVNGQLSLSDRLLALRGPCHRPWAPRGDGVGQRKATGGRERWRERERALLAPCHWH